MKRILLAGAAISMVASAALAQQDTSYASAARRAVAAQAQNDQGGRGGGGFPAANRIGRGQQPPPAPPAPPPPPPPPPAPPAPQAQAATPAQNAGRGGQPQSGAGRGPGQGGRSSGRGPGQGGAQSQAQVQPQPQAQSPVRQYGPFTGRVPQPGERGYDPRYNQPAGRGPGQPNTPPPPPPPRGPQNPSGPSGRGGQGGQPGRGPNGQPGRGPVGQPAGRDGGRIGAPPSRTWDANRFGGRPVYSGGQYMRQRDEGRRWYAPDYFRPYYYAPRQFIIRNWLPPLGFYVYNWSYGDYLPLGWYDPSDYLDWAYYGLPFPPVGCEWVRVGQDAVLVDVWSGEILSVEYDLFYY